MMDGVENLNVRALLELVNIRLSDKLDSHLFEPNEPVDVNAFVQRQIEALERFKQEGLITSYVVPAQPLTEEWTIVLKPPVAISAKIVANDTPDGLV